MSLLIKNVVNSEVVQDVYIENEMIKEIGNNLDYKASQIIDAGYKRIMPSFFNAHTHSAMTLLRGYADDMFLQEWLEKKIWPVEGRMTEEDIYWGTKLACLEMIKTGTTFFNDMYWFWHGTARAAEEMGLRGLIGAAFIDGFNDSKAEEQIKFNQNLYKEKNNYGDKVMFSLSPHSIFTVSEKSLKWCSRFSNENGIPIHIHLSETEKEVNDCLKSHGMRPVEYLESIGFLSPLVIAAHCVWLNDNEIEILHKYDVKIAHNPVSNMKLAVGNALPYKKLKQAGITISLGTDGCSSNNSLDMLESMKFASLLQKFHSNDSCVLNAKEALEMATKNGARAFGLKAGEISPGYLADIILIDDNRAELTPNYNIISDIVYSANGYCVDTVICGGKILMKSRFVENEEEIIAKGKETAKKLISYE